MPYGHASMLLLGEGSEATEPYNKYDKIRPHSIRSLQFDQKFRPLSFRPEKFDLFTATQSLPIRSRIKAENFILKAIACRISSNIVVVVEYRRNHYGENLKLRPVFEEIRYFSRAFFAAVFKFRLNALVLFIYLFVPVLLDILYDCLSIDVISDE